MKKKNVLITGANGFLGKNIAKYFSKKGYNVVGVGHGKWSKELPADWGISRWYQADLSLDFLNRQNIVFDLIVHCAGSSSVSHSIQYPDDDFNKNVLTVLYVLEYLRLNKYKTRFIFPSSTAVYGNSGDLKIKEDSPLKPVSPYGYNKKIAEELCELYSEQYGLNIAVIRFFSFYGPGLVKQLIWDACEKIKNSKNGKIEFYGTGSETRDLIHIDDACSLIFKIAKSKNKFVILNGGSGVRVQVKRVIEILIKHSGKNITAVFNGKIKVGDPKYYWANITKAKKIGWAPKIKLVDGIKDYLAFYDKTRIMHKK